MATNAVSQTDRMSKQWPPLPSVGCHLGSQKISRPFWSGRNTTERGREAIIKTPLSFQQIFPLSLSLSLTHRIVALIKLSNFSLSNRFFSKDFESNQTSVFWWDFDCASWWTLFPVVVVFFLSLPLTHTNLQSLSLSHSLTGSLISSITMELFSRRRWTTGSAQQSNM